MKRTAFVYVLCLCASIHVSAQAVRIVAAAAPRWISHRPTDYTNSTQDAEAEEGKIDLDYENQVDLASQCLYVRHTIKLISEAGVQSGSEIAVNFDPSFQTLMFHEVKIIRGSQTIDKLVLSKVKTVHQEKELEKFIYNNKRTAVLFVEDVRKGDVLEYSYTIKGFSPLQKKYSDDFRLQFSVPVCQLYYKLIVPPGRAIHIKNGGSALAPTKSEENGATVYQWSASHLSPLSVPENIPGWYDPYPKLYVSEYNNWKEVIDWALPLFSVPSTVSGPLKEKIEAIKSSCPTAEERALAALRFVQDEIRYLGMEMGENGQKPHRPDQILRQRFGDCKDKSFLLCTMLYQLGIEAHPVLINTDNKNMVGEALPTPDAFNHCTVQAVTNNNIYWFDPTISYQRGPIESIYYPDYQTGLVISEKTGGLTTIPFHPRGKEMVSEVFDVPDMSGTAHLTVTTQFTGSYADDNRDYFKNNSTAEVKKSFLKYYHNYFDKIDMDTITWRDDEKTGMLTSIEKYTIDQFWGSMSSMQKASFEPFVIEQSIKRPKQEDRTMPYALPFPVAYDENIEVNLPSYWRVKESNDEIKSNSFLFRARFAAEGKRVLLNYHYENLKDHIAPKEFRNYLADLNKVDGALAYDLTSNTTGYDDTAEASTPGGNYNYLYVLLGILVIITYRVRKGRNS